MAIKKYSKVKFTLRKELLIILGAVVLMVVATILFNLPNKEEKFLKKWNEAGSTVAEKLVYEETTFEDLENIIKSDEYVFVLFATPDASCVTVFDSVYNYALTTYEIDTVYLVDSEFVMGKNRDEDKEFDEKLVELEGKFKDAEGNSITLDKTPNIWVFKDGKLVAEADQDLITAEGSWDAAIISILNYSKLQ